MEENHHCHYSPLITTSASAITINVTQASNLEIATSNDENCGTRQSSSNSSIYIISVRVVLVILIGCVSLWANKEANKGFEISIQNDANESPSGRKFQLLYVSNDEAARLVVETSQFVEALLYPAHHHDDAIINSVRKKQVESVTLRLASQHNLTHLVSVESLSSSSSSYEEEKGGKKFVINLSPSIMEESNVKEAVTEAIRQGMARVWVFDNAPSSLINGMVEYIRSSLSAIPNSMATAMDSSDPGSNNKNSEDNNILCCWKVDPKEVVVAHFLSYCEAQSKGFIQRLNQAMSGSSSGTDWHDQAAVDNALGMPLHHLCSSNYTSHELLLSNSVDSISQYRQ